MKHSDKELLLKDLCARLPYRVKYNYGGFDGCDYTMSRVSLTAVDDFPIEDIKPYLFPLSSMTEEQCYRLASIRSCLQDCWKYIKTPIPLAICNFEQINWFHKNYIDYRGLIEKGLAIDATELNIY